MLPDPDDEKPVDCAPGSLAGTAPMAPLKPYRERIADAQANARARRVAAGLLAEPDNGPFSDELLAARAKGRRRKR